MPEPVLSVDGIASGYGDIQVLRQVSVQVWPGRISVLLGSNGAGKTTTLRAAAGLNRVTAGSVRLLGHDVTAVPAPARVRMGLGFVMEGKRLFHRRTVEDNLLLGGYRCCAAGGRCAIGPRPCTSVFRCWGSAGDRGRAS